MRAFRLVIAVVLGTGSFIWIWFLLEMGLGQDQESALTLSGVIAALVGSIGLWWATLPSPSKTNTVWIVFAIAIAILAASWHPAVQLLQPRGNVAATPTDQDPPASLSAPRQRASLGPSLQPVSPLPSFPLSSADHDLIIVGPSQATLKPENGRYEGTITITVLNIGRQVSDGNYVQMKLPAFVEATTFVGLNGCVLHGPPEQPSGSQQSTCISEPYIIPARGGRATYAIGLVANIAPQREQMVLTGAQIKAIAQRPGNAANHYVAVEIQDATPANNWLAVTLILIPS